MQQHSYHFLPIYFLIAFLSSTQGRICRRATLVKIVLFFFAQISTQTQTKRQLYRTKYHN